MYITYVKPDRIVYNYHPSFRPWLRRWNKEQSTSNENQIDFIPRVNVTSNEDGYILHFELPGMNKDDIKMSFTENILNISGERKIKSDNNTIWIRSERVAGKFERSIRFKKEVMGSKISAAYEDGILKVVAPYADEVKSKPITIN